MLLYLKQLHPDTLFHITTDLHLVYSTVHILGMLLCHEVKNHGRRVIDLMQGHPLTQ